MKRRVLLAVVILVILLEGCTFNPATFRQLNSKLEENSQNLEKNTLQLIELSKRTSDLYLNLQIWLARLKVRDEFRGAYLAPTVTNPSATIKTGKLSDPFQKQNSDLQVNFISEAAYFKKRFESPNSFTVFTAVRTQRYDFFEFYAKVLNGQVEAIGGDLLKKYRKTQEEYHKFLDKYRPARTHVERRAAYRKAFREFEEVIKKQLDNNSELLKGYQHIAALKDPFTEIVTSLPMSKDTKELILGVTKEVNDSGVLCTIIEGQN